MDFRKTLYLDMPPDLVRYRVKNYFKRQGYQPVQTDKATYYERGSRLYNLIAFNPAHWHVLGLVTLDRTEDKVAVHVQLLVDSQGQTVLRRERHYWEAVFDALTAYLETGEDNQEQALRDLGKANERSNYRLAIGLIGGLFLCGVISCAGLFLLASQSHCACPR